MWWVNVQGVHPQTGETVNAWDCSINWIPVLTVDVARQARSGAAATESFRNTLVEMASNPIRRADGMPSRAVGGRSVSGALPNKPDS